MGSAAVLVAALGWVLPLFTGWADSWSSIERAARKITTIQAEFEQTKDLKLLSRPLVAKGRFYFRRSGDLRWEYVSPIRSVLINGKQGVHRSTWRNGRFMPDADRPTLIMATIWLYGQCSVFIRHREQLAMPPVSLALNERAVDRLSSLISGWAIGGLGQVSVLASP